MVTDNWPCDNFFLPVSVSLTDIRPLLPVFDMYPVPIVFLFININVSGFITASNINVSGAITATSFVGEGQIGVGSEGTFIGTGVTMVDFKSSNALNTVDLSSGIATVTVTTGASIGLVIALGG